MQGIRIFLIFAPKHSLWVRVRIAPPRKVVLTHTHNLICDGIASLCRISWCTYNHQSASNMQIRNSKLYEAIKCWVYKRSKPPLVGDHAFPLTGFAVAWLGHSLHYVLSKKKIKHFLLKIINFYNLQKISILHGHVLVMNFTPLAIF